MSAVIRAYSTSSRTSASISLRPAMASSRRSTKPSARFLNTGLEAIQQVGFLRYGAE